MATDPNIRQITIEGGRTVYIGVRDIRSFYNYESKLIIEMIDGTTYNVNGAPNVDAFFATTFVIDPTEITMTNDPLNIREIPISLTITQSSTVLSTVSKIILSANANRKYLIIRNISAADATIFIHFGSGAATTANSLPLKKGEYYELPEDFTYTGVLTAISSGFGSDNVSVLEGF